MNRPAPRHKSTSLVHDVIFLDGIWNFPDQPTQGSESSKAHEIGTLPVDQATTGTVYSTPEIFPLANNISVRIGNC
jgi:hypothetical protein